MKLKRGQRNLILWIINVAVLMAAALILHSRAASDAAPTSGPSFALAGESGYVLAPPTQALDSASAVPSSRSKALQDVVTGALDAGTSSEPREIADIPALAPEQGLFAPLVADEELLLYADAGISGAGVSSNVRAWSAAGASQGAGGSPGRYSRAAASPGGYGGGGGAPLSSQRGGSSPGPAEALLPELNGNGLSTAQLLRSSNAPSPVPAAFPDVRFTAPGGFGEIVNLPPQAQSSNAAFAQTVTTLQTPVAVPEPVSLLLFGSSVAALLYRRTRNRAH